MKSIPKQLREDKEKVKYVLVKKKILKSLTKDYHEAHHISFHAFLHMFNITNGKMALI